MIRIPCLMLACAVMVLMCSGAVCAETLLSDSFDSCPLGALSLPWKLNISNSTTQAQIVNNAPGNTTQAIWFQDTNMDTTNNNVLTTFSPISTGICAIKLDVCLTSIHAGFGIRINNGGSVTSINNWLACIKFEGDMPLATGAEPGTLSYQTSVPGYTPVGPLVRYSANTWYTVKIEANLDMKIYQIYFGPRGGTLAQITPSAGVPFIKNFYNVQAGTAGGFSIFSSLNVEPGASIYIDNAAVTSDAEYPKTVAQVKALPIGTMVILPEKVVSAGSDQTNRPFFYIQDSSGGIRVRSSVTARQGDKVLISGTIQRTSDGGISVMRTCEREINASAVTVTYGPFTMAKPVGMTNRAVGGGPWGPIDTDGCPCQPGVWARSTGDTSGYDQISETGLNNIGRLVRVWGKVIYADDTNRFFYIDDGSGVTDGSRLANGASSPKGIRILAPPGPSLSLMVGKYATVTGVVGAVAQNEAGWPNSEYIRSIRVVRAACEPFLDRNLNGYWDAGEEFIDNNASGGYDGIKVDGIPGPLFYSGFDRYGTAIYRGAPFLVKSIYLYSPDTPSLEEAVRQGFNTIVSFDYMTPADLPNLNAYGLKTLPCLRSPSLRPSWMAARHDPAILGWYTHDEPDGQGISPDQALLDYQWVKAQDPMHFAGQSHFLIDAWYNYRNSDEFAISDCYPVLSSTSYIIPMADHIANAHYTAHGSVYFPVWQHVQIFDAYPQVLPTPTQLRAMVYLALAFNVKGIMYFSYQRPNLPNWPLDWAEAKKMNGELDLFKGFLTLPWVPMDATTSTESVRIGGFRVGGSALIIAVNVTADVRTATFNLPGIGASSLTLPLEGNTTQALTNRSFTQTFQPYQVHVYLLGDIPQAPQ